jgi:peptide/nickel transport system substrate-binding protein
VGPTGTLNIGFKELFTYGNSPRLTESAVMVFVGGVSQETLLKLNIDKEIIPQLVTDWTLDDSGTVWTMKLREGVEFSKGWGQFTADDVVFSLQEYAADDGIGSLLGRMQTVFAAEGGGPTAVDDFTITIDTVTPQFDTLYLLIIPEVNNVISKENYDSEGQDAATFQGVGTGPWEFTESSTREFWKFAARENHYRKTPEFAELVLWDIPEEATRVANFETGKLDSFLMAFDSKPRLDSVPDIRYMSIPHGSTAAIHLHPQHYVGIGDADYAEKRPAAAECLANPGSCPWFSPDPDVNSAEWERARKVREAMLISINRQEIVDTLLSGEGSPQSLWLWENRQMELDPDLREWEFNPERARQLLKEVGLEDGFEIEVTLSVRGVAAEEESCDAVANYWQDIGIRSKINRVPYVTIGPKLNDRSYSGLSCHGTGGRVDPATLYDILYSSKAGFSAGFDHPIMDDLLTRMFGIADDEGHWAIMNEMARFIYENALDSGFYSVNILFPLGPKVDSWREHLQQGRPDALGSYEFAKPRKQ